ncbi:hypothetical protein COV24_00035 [candidate division WWE3 bacterium CG10_big_fil_rev_8_21_14_0_10_32_10]|uniref:Uncharacterized protein n=1 Tax=candidate division WWE3 bacterium CG10_big_fil_rev_8_21_14_0_10_32_10 TaxID=1975090 RepID=A0A2H0RC37_UNCKA|nr:MAG: hypothetical protein COV24_00035 [candidate division WWE3 bacterium CG10_big_fil_rev_8_21_14_0_10_32_10]
MDFKEFIKNPSKLIWDYIDKISGKKTQEEEYNSNSSQNKMSLGDAVLPKTSSNIFSTFIKKDWSWLFKGKVGLFLKITIPLILILLIIQPFFIPKNVPVTPTPPVVDPGDILIKPDFEDMNYINGVENEGTFLIYSPKINQINEFGVRGILLSSIPTPSSDNSFYFPVNKETYLFYTVSTLYLHFPYIEIQNEGTSQEVSVKKEKNVPLVDNIENLNKITNLHKTAEGNIAFTLKKQVPTEVSNEITSGSNSLSPSPSPTVAEPESVIEKVDEKMFFYTYSPTGELLKEYEIPDSSTSDYTYFAGEVFFIRAEGTNHYLVKLNNNNEEIYKQDMGEYMPYKIRIVNSTRFLILFKNPSDSSMFFVKMLDSGNLTVFQFTPKEEVLKMFEVTSFTFEENTKETLLVGSKVAKLFDQTGNQLWIH